MGTTASSYGVGQILRDRLRNFMPLGISGGTIGQRTNNRVFFNRPPDNPSYPYVLVNVKRLRQGSDSNQRNAMWLEVTIYGRDDAQLPLVETIADIADQAFTRFASYTDGLVFGSRAQRMTLPPPQEPVSRQLVAVRCLYEMVEWPAYLAAVQTY
jgi:hypothetical protein